MNYYVAKKVCFLKAYDRVAARVGEILRRHYEPDRVKAILRKTHSMFEGLLPRIPYIGGRANPFTNNLIQAAWCLAFYKAMKSFGESAETSGRILYEAVEVQLHTYPRLLLYPCCMTKLNRQTIDDIKKKAVESQERKDPQGWVFRVVDGDGKNFDLGLDYEQCGMTKFFHTQRADDFAPYLCAINCAVSQAFRIDLSQNQLIATGDKLCRLRFKKRTRNPKREHAHVLEQA
ncbi:MAG TPA: L-2-amino-thiazoline-4-carboxylic acid hydrolase [Aggregatilineales bacterium]|nr:L-2-amino-thiazoline-4-carboxylic acid hydrolase [Aggregatilineales bacterium]